MTIRTIGARDGKHDADAKKQGDVACGHRLDDYTEPARGNRWTRFLKLSEN
jgi:hypothetical protein